MNKNSRWNQAELGQTAVLFALMLIGLIAFVGLAVDGGNIFNARRIAQNAADSGALTGVHYMVGRDRPTEIGLLEVVNSVVEANGIPDTDGVWGNAINENISVYYTNAQGLRLTDPRVAQECDVVGTCSETPDQPGSIPSTARGVEVVVKKEAETFLLGVIGRESANVGADAVAAASGRPDIPGIGDNVLVAFGPDCVREDEALDVSAEGVEIIGGVHSGSWFWNTNYSNHYHGQVTYVDGYVDTYQFDSNERRRTVYEPDPPRQVDPPEEGNGDPLAGLFTADSFQCTAGAGDVGSIGSTLGAECFDLVPVVESNPSRYGGKVTTQLLRENSPDGGVPYLDSATGQLRDGLYYAGQYPFDFGMQGMVGKVTLVSEAYIKITERDVKLSGYMPSESEIPELLFYSALDAGERKCDNHNELPQEFEPINTTGNTGTERPSVSHSGGCVDLANPESCYWVGSLRYSGIIYAPGGRVATSGDGATYEGAIIAYSIRINGSTGRRPGEPQPVGALFVSNPYLFPESDQRIHLEQ